MTKLTDKQYTFVTSYIRNGFNSYKAAKAAGYSEGYALVKACKLIDQPAIRERIDKALDKVLAIEIKEKADVLLKIIYDIVPQDGSEPKRKHYPDAIRAISELNKMQGDYAPDKRLSITVDATQKRLNDARKQYEEY